jgi:hypothetical protein
MLFIVHPLTYLTLTSHHYYVHILLYFMYSIWDCLVIDKSTLKEVTWVYSHYQIRCSSRPSCILSITWFAAAPVRVVAYLKPVTNCIY